jgi:hypothetical protein
MAIVLFSNALTSEESKQTDGNERALRLLFALSATRNVADKTYDCGIEGAEQAGTYVYTRVLGRL